MSRRTSGELIRELAGDLEPVRPVARLSVVATTVFAIAGFLVALFLWMRPMPVDAESFRDPVFDGVFAGLLLTGVGAVIAALAASIPGRESVSRGARGIGAIGFALAAGVGGIAVITRGTGAETGATPVLMCLGWSLLLGAVPAVAVAAWIARAFAHRPAAAAALAAAGCVSLGAVTAHLTCATGGAGHVFFGHALAPIFGGAVAALPLVWIARRGAAGRTHSL